MLHTWDRRDIIIVVQKQREVKKMEPTFVLNRDMFDSLMEDQHMKVYQLADAMGVTPSTVYRIMNGDTRVSSYSMAKMVKAFGLDDMGMTKLFPIAPVLHGSNEQKEAAK